MLHCPNAKLPAKLPVNCLFAIKQPLVGIKQFILFDNCLTIVWNQTIKPHKKPPMRRKTESQIKRFINEVYCCEGPKNAEIHFKLSVSTKNIYDTIMQYSTIFERRTTQSFATWCRNNRLKFLNNKDNVVKGIRVRELYVMEEIYYDSLIFSISKYLPNYQGSVRNLIHQGYEIVGYARKSPGDENENDRIKLLQDMINNLSERSFAQRIYVSPNSCASTPFFERDLKPNDNIMDRLEDIRGNSQDMLEYLNSVDHDICLVSIDFAGLTSRTNDTIQLIENNIHQEDCD